MRQDIVKALPPLSVISQNRKVVFEYINYDQEMIEAKQKAAGYFYAHGSMLLNKGDRENARTAYYELLRVKDYNADFKDVDDLIIKAAGQGTSNVLFKMKNQTGIPLPPRFEEDLGKISLEDMNRKWLRYFTKENKEVYYDYSVIINMKVIDVSPENVKEIRYTETKEVPDGWKYILDAKGNVKKDSLGNDIKVPAFKTIVCNIIETQQRKAARIAGTIDYINNRSGQLIKSDPITADAFFEHNSLLPLGDVAALKPETKAKIGSSPVPFPPDFDLLMQAGETIKKMTKDILYTNKGVIY
jgi:hypothetical protein